MAVFGGWFVLNFIRIFFIAMLAPCLVDCENKNDGKTTCCSSLFTCLFVPKEAKNIVKDIKIVVYLMEGKSPEKKPRNIDDKN
jgi:hypothetical protein